MTKVTLKTTDPLRDAHDALIVLVHEGERLPDWIGEVTDGAAQRAVKSGDFKGAQRKAALFYGNGKAARVILAGLGAKKELSLERVRQAVGVAAREASRVDAARLGVVPPLTLPKRLNEADVLGAVAEALVLSRYRFDRHKGKASGKGAKKKKKVARVNLYGERASRAAITRAVAAAEGANLARDLANEPGNVATPSHLAAAARKAGRSAGFSVKVLAEADMKRLGMGGLLGVAKGSHEPARFIQMEYSPRNARKSAGTICLVGKGLTFDSGGISLKPSDKMWDMKFDKCGGCAVIGAMAAIANAKLPAKVVGLVPSTENMPGGNATKPGDILTALNGKTIEVQNTDAEGRLILADALAYADRFHPDVIVDMATLTGAVVVALGDVRAAVLTSDDALRTALQAAGDATGELLWPLPMDAAYGEHVKSDVADVKNLGKGRAAGSIAGGWFLRNFVPKGTPWAHLDIAGTAWSADPSRTYLGKGATGFGARLAFEFVRARCE